jgi:hypothetical protein
MSLPLSISRICIISPFFLFLFPTTHEKNATFLYDAAHDPPFLVDLKIETIARNATMNANQRLFNRTKDANHSFSSLLYIDIIELLSFDNISFRVRSVPSLFRS